MASHVERLDFKQHIACCTAHYYAQLTLALNTPVLLGCPPYTPWYWAFAAPLSLLPLLRLLVKDHLSLNNPSKEKTYNLRDDCLASSQRN